MRKEWQEILWIHALAISLVILILVATGCGTGIGNPENEYASGSGAGAPVSADPAPQAGEIAGPAEEYAALDFSGKIDAIDCGAYTEKSDLSAVDTGRLCIRAAFSECRTAKYLLDATNIAGARFVSFVSVAPTGENPEVCTLSIHTVSNDPTKFVGDARATCGELSETESIELACGIGQ